MRNEKCCYSCGKLSRLPGAFRRRPSLVKWPVCLSSSCVVWLVIKLTGTLSKCTHLGGYIRGAKDYGSSHTLM